MAARSEGAPGSPEELFSCRDIYNAAVNALLAQGEYRGDAHYLHGDIELGDLEDTQPGTFRLTDYHASDSAAFVYRDEKQWGTDAEEQRRLLEARDTVLSIVLHKAEGKTFQYPSFIILWPGRIRPGSTIGLFLHSDETGTVPLVTVPDAWPEDQPLIIRTNGLGNHAVVTEPGRDTQLQRLYQAFGNRTA